MSDDVKNSLFIPIPHDARTLRKLISEDMKRMMDATILQKMDRAMIEVQAMPERTGKVLYSEEKFEAKGRHPSQCIQWLLKSLDFGEDPVHVVNADLAGEAIQSELLYNEDMVKWGLEYTSEEKALEARLTALGDTLELTDHEPDWRAVRRLLEGFYDDKLGGDRLPYALTQGNEGHE